MEVDLPEDVFGFAMLRVEKRGGLCVAVGGDPARLAYCGRFPERETVGEDGLPGERSRHAGTEAWLLRLWISLVWKRRLSEESFLASLASDVIVLSFVSLGSPLDYNRSSFPYSRSSRPLSHDWS